MKNVKNPVVIQATSSDWDGSFQQMSWWKKEAIQNARVMVVGAGALGNEVIKNLTLLGVGNILVVDYDTIEYTNLSRSILFRHEDCGRKKGEVAIEKIKQINESVKGQYIDGDIAGAVGLGVFRRMDVVIGCLDNRLARLAINRLCHKVNKTWIDGGIKDLGGHAYVFKPGKTCYECTLTSSDRRLLEYKLSCLDVAYQHASSGRIATTPIAASLIAAIQVQEALKAINQDMEQNQMLEEFFYYEGLSNTVLQRQYPVLKDGCSSHYHYHPILETPLSNKMKIWEIRQWLSNHLNDEDPHIELDTILVHEVTGKVSEKTTAFDPPIPKSKIDNAFIRKHTDKAGEELILTKRTSTINQSFLFQELTLEECGIPPLHIIRVLTDEGEFYVELAGDEGFIKFE